MEKVYICGLTASGKGLMRPLLDGHPELITCPFQGLGVGILLDDFSHLLLRKKVRPLSDRVRLVHERTKKLKVNINGETIVIRVSELIYFILCFGGGFRELLDGCINGAIRAGRAQGKEYFVDFECDWLCVFREIERRLEQLDKIDCLEQLVDIAYSSLLGEWHNRNTQLTENSKVVISSTNRLTTITSILKNSQNSKIIVMVRDVVGRTFTNAKHIRNKNATLSGYEEIDVSSLSADNLWLKFDGNLYSKEFLRESKTFVDAVNDLSERYSNLTLVRFEDLFVKKIDVMDRLADFLSIERSPSLYQATLNSIPLETSTNELFSGTMVDDPSEILTGQQKRYIRFLYGEKDVHCNLFETVSFKLLATKFGTEIAKVLSYLFKRYKLI